MSERRERKRRERKGAKKKARKKRRERKGAKEKARKKGAKKRREKRARKKRREKRARGATIISPQKYNFDLLFYSRLVIFTSPLWILDRLLTMVRQLVKNVCNLLEPVNIAILLAREQNTTVLHIFTFIIAHRLALVPSRSVFVVSAGQMTKYRKLSSIETIDIF